jgi:DNA-binding transcriptional LysR family regulator
MPEGGSIAQLTHMRAAEHNRIPKIRIYVTSFDAACRMVQSGLGISIIPDVLARVSAKTMRIKAIPLREVWATRTLYVGVREYHALPVTARLLVDHLSHSQPAVSKREG